MFIKYTRIIICLVCALLIYIFLSIDFNKQNNIQAEPTQSTQTTTTTTETTTTVLTTNTTKNDIEDTTKANTTTKKTTNTQPTKKQTTTKQATKSSSNFGVFKSYTDYRMLSKSSKQWKLQEQAYTDENGLRKIGDAYLVALGSYYGTTLGTRYTVTLSNGSVFDIILCDCKQDRHTDSSNRVCLSNGSVLEFYVDGSALPKRVKTMGTISAIPYFSGSVVSIEKNN